MKIRKPFTTHPRDAYQTINNEPSLTEEALNHDNRLSTPNVVKRYLSTGDDSLLNAKVPSPFTQLPELTFQEALNNIVAGEAAFMALPSKVRKEFDNNPMAFVDAFHKDPETLQRLGILPAPQMAENQPQEPSQAPSGEES